MCKHQASENQFLCCYTLRHIGTQGSNQYSNIQTNIGFIFIQILPIIHLLFEVVFIGQITLNLARFLSINTPFLLILRQLAFILEQYTEKTDGL